MEMVKRVGRALAKLDGYAYDPVPYDAQARAAIAAMREPSEAMESAFYDKQAECEDGYGAQITAAEALQVMINAALGGPNQ